MLRNTSDGNELAVPAINALQRHTRWLAAHALVCRGPRLGAALASIANSTAALYCLSLPGGGGAGLRQCSALKAIDIVKKHAD